MTYTWNEAKNRRNLKLHGIAFEDAARIFEGPTVEQTDDRFDYGETRFRAFAYSGDQGRCLVFTVSGDQTIRVISYRRARRREMQRYGL